MAARLRYSILPSSDIEPERSSTSATLSGGRSFACAGVDVEAFKVHDDVDDRVAAGQDGGLIEQDLAAHRIGGESQAKAERQARALGCTKRQWRHVAKRARKSIGFDCDMRLSPLGVRVPVRGAVWRVTSVPSDLATMRE